MVAPVRVCSDANYHNHRFQNRNIKMSDQLKEALRLLERAWITVDFWDHKGEFSAEIRKFLDEQKKPEQSNFWSRLASRRFSKKRPFFS